MEVSVNGERTSIAGPSRLSDLLQQLRMQERPCAVEVNRNLIPRREHEAFVLSEGDEVEIVTLVGGG